MVRMGQAKACHGKTDDIVSPVMPGGGG